MRGLFFTFEGPEGGGKTTQAGHLAEALRRQGREVLLTREPGGTPAGEAVRRVLQHDEAGARLAPEAEMLLFAASRAQLVRAVIAPALARGAWVVCDRFADSTAAYQGYGRGLDLGTIARINALAVDGCTPDLTFLLDLDVRAGFERLARRYGGAGGGGHDRFEREDPAFHERVRAGYLALAAQAPARYRVVDSRRDEADVRAEILAAAEEAAAGKAGRHGAG